MWEQRKSTVIERLKTLEQAIATLAATGATDSPEDPVQTRRINWRASSGNVRVAARDRPGTLRLR